MHYIRLFVFLCCFPFMLTAQLSNVIPSSSSVANSSVADISRWSSFVNPASLVSYENLSFGFQYENRYFIDELSTKSISIAYPTKFVDIGFSGSYFGYSAYNEIMIGLGFARNFSDKFNLGVQFNYQTAYFLELNQYYGALFPQIGLTVNLSPTFTLGFSTFNPFQTQIDTEMSSVQLASVFSIGCTYNFSNDLLMRFQLDKELSSTYRFAGGLEYTILELFVFKAGAYDNQYLVPCIGFEISLPKMNLNINTELHPLLGLINSCSLAFSF